MTTDPTMLERLIGIQVREKWTDGRMATEIGISRPSWNLIRRGRRNLKPDVAMQAAGRWPELTRELLALVPSGTERQNEATA